MTVLIQDDFNRAGPGLGTNWTTDATVSIISNKVRAGDTFTAAYAIHNTAPGTADYTVSAQLTQAELLSQGAVGLGLIGRYQDVNNFYLAWLDEFGTTVKLYRVVTGSYVQIGSLPITAQADPVNFTLSCNGTTLRVLLNGVQQFQVTGETTHTAAGLTGLRTYNSAILPNHRFDDFLVEDIPVPPTTSIQQRTPVGITAASGAGFTMPVPTGVADGDFLIAAVGTATTTTPNAPTGWTKSTVATAGTAHAVSVYTARYSTGLTRSFTNVAAAASAVCNAYYWPNKTVLLDVAAVAATSATNNATMPTGAPTTGPVADDFEALAYCWTANVTLSTPASGSTINITQANGTTLRVAMGRNDIDNLPANATVTAFSQTLSGSSTRKAGFGILLKAVVYKEISGTSSGSAPVSGVISKTPAPTGGYKDISGTADGVASNATVTPTRKRALTVSASSVSTVSAQLSASKTLGSRTSNGTSTASALISVKQTLSATSNGVSTAAATATRKRALTAGSSGIASTTVNLTRRRSLTGTSNAVASTGATVIRAKRALVAASSGVSSTVATPIARRALVATSSGVALATGTVQKAGATVFTAQRAQGTADKLVAEIRAGAVFNAALATATAQKLTAGTASGTAFSAALLTATGQSTAATINTGFRFSAELATATAQSLVAQYNTGTIFSGALASATAQKLVITVGTGTTFPGVLATASSLSHIAIFRLSTGLQAQLMASSASALDSTLRSGVVLPAQIATSSALSSNAIMRISTGILGAVAIGSASASQASILAGVRIIAESMTATAQTHSLSISSTGLFLAQRMQASGDLKTASIYLGKIWPAQIMSANVQSHVITHITGGTWSANVWVVNGQLRIAVWKESFGITSPGPDIIYADNVLPVIVNATYLVPYLYAKDEMVPTIVRSDEV